MVDNKNNHYVPEFYLRYWANKLTNKVWVYSKVQKSSCKKPNPSELHVRRVCSEDYLYWIGNDPAIEIWAGKNVETICGEVFKKINNKDKLDEKSVLFAKAFLALSIARHPSLKNSSEKILRAASPETIPINPLAQKLRKHFELKLAELNQLNLQILCIPDEINTTFITSDVPFFIFPIRKETTPSENEEIFQDRNYYWFPISPKRIGFLSEKEHTAFYEDITDFARIQNINIEFYMMANDILVATNSESFESFKDIFAESAS
jgi:hypothetical protein